MANTVRQNNLEVNQDDFLRGSPLRSSLKKSGSSNRLERNRSPAPIREIPGVAVPQANDNNLAQSLLPAYNNNPDNMGDDSPRNNSNNNRNRFTKKKMTNRSKSVETPQYIPADNNFMEFDNQNRKSSVPAKSMQYGEGSSIGSMLSRNPFIINNSKVEIPTIVISNDRINSDRPTLARQNAVSKAFAKSLGDNLNRLHEDDIKRISPVLPNDRNTRNTHHYPETNRRLQRNRKYRRHRRNNYASSSLTSTESEDSISYSTTESSLTSSSGFSPREATLNLQRLNKSRNQTGYENMSMRARNGRLYFEFI